LILPDAEAEHCHRTGLCVAEGFQVDPAHGRGRKAHAVAQQHGQDIDQHLVDEPLSQALTGQVGTEDLQVLPAG
jgi:hypothetical protein